MPATEQHEIREHGGSTVGPMLKMMALAEAYATARKATAAVAIMESPPQRRRNRTRAGADLHYATVRVVSHDDPTGIARQALGRSSWNARAILEDGLARRVGVGQDVGIDVDHNLIPLSRSTGIEVVAQGRLGEQFQGVGLQLLHRRRVGFRRLVAPMLIQGFPSCGQGLHEQRAYLGC